MLCLFLQYYDWSNTVQKSMCIVYLQHLLKHLHRSCQLLRRLGDLLSAECEPVALIVCVVHVRVIFYGTSAI